MKKEKSYLNIPIQREFEVYYESAIITEIFEALDRLIGFAWRITIMMIDQQQLKGNDTFTFSILRDHVDELRILTLIRSPTCLSQQSLY
ncbi:hypothetical protein DERF_004231 [Dermatophagoides farinae]|uniref:Uncharacterized protein n=1 Tax=Dermatophagoides farinae TaxID=6954 RepID=A0A922L7I0_DERFA|nr:hypothetical protein DERF_004231 [Dermatophagoides farinae]